MQFSTKIDGFEQKDSQGFENSYNSYEQYPLEKFFIFTIYQNYTLALRWLYRNGYSIGRLWWMCSDILFLITYGCLFCKLLPRQSTVKCIILYVLNPLKTIDFAITHISHWP